jgi:elongation factor P
MNMDDYNQIFLNGNLIDNSQFLKEGDMVDIIFNAEDESPLTCDLPAHVVLEITQTEPGLKGNTATNATKPAVTETGASINVPLFINEGDKIKIDTAKGAYMERVKE